MVRRKEILICNPKPLNEESKLKPKKNILLMQIEVLSKYAKTNKLSKKEEAYLNHNLTKILRELKLLS